MNGDEVLVKDKDGKWRVWRDGQWLETAKPGEAPSPALPAHPEVAVSPTPVVVPASVVKSEVAVAPTIPTLASDAPAVSDPIDRIVQAVIKELHLTALTPELKPRLENAVKLRLKDIRDTVDTREVLRKSVEEGGLGLAEEVSDNIIQVILSHLSEVRQIAATPGSAPAPMVEQVAQTPSAPASILYRPQSALASPASKVISEPITASPQPSASLGVTPPPAPAPARSASSERGSMVDVRAKPVTVGPVDELRLFGLIDFRRLDPNPKQAAARLKEKVKLLEDESYEKMVEGVRAWRGSPLHSLYVALGQESLASNRPISEVISNRKTAGQNSLTEAEFEAVMELNRSLRF